MALDTTVRQDRKVADVIERLGVGPFWVKEICVGAGLSVASGAQLIVISATTWVISHEWRLDGWQRSSLVSILFVGKLAGNLVGGPFSDAVGRRLPIVFSYAAVCLYGIMAASASGFEILCTARFVLGVATGVSQSAWTALLSEITPADSRMMATLASSSFFAIGMVYGGYLVWLDDPQLKMLAWRWITMMSVLPAAIFGIAASITLKESASWLALHGENNGAEDILRSIQWWNSKEQEPVNFSPVKADAPQSDMESLKMQLDVAFGTTMRYTTAVLCFTCFVLNFVYYGGVYSFPLILGHVDMGVSPAGALILGVLWELPGFVAAGFCDKHCGRRSSILWYLALVTLSISVFIKSAAYDEKFGPVNYMAHAGYAGSKCWIHMGFLIVYQYVVEVYPTSARAAGTGLCLGCGRLGSIAVPFVFEAMAGWFDDMWQPFFYMMATFCAVNVLLVLMLPFETWGMTLKDHVNEMKETEPLVNWTKGV